MADIQEVQVENQIIRQRTSTQRAHRTAIKSGIDLKPADFDKKLTQIKRLLPNGQNEEADIM